MGRAVDRKEIIGISHTGRPRLPLGRTNTTNMHDYSSGCKKRLHLSGAGPPDIPQQVDRLAVLPGHRLNDAAQLPLCDGLPPNWHAAGPEQAREAGGSALCTAGGQAQDTGLLDFAHLEGGVA